MRCEKCNGCISSFELKRPKWCAKEECPNGLLFRTKPTKTYYLMMAFMHKPSADTVFMITLKPEIYINSSWYIFARCEAFSFENAWRRIGNPNEWLDD